MIQSINTAGGGGGGGADEKVKVSANDTTEGYLNGKLVAGTNITLTENNDGSNETLTIAASGLTGFTPSQNTASPNNTVNASRLLVDATSTNADAVIQPKGTGALLAQLPDGTTTGGNKRGSNAVDLQTARDSNSQIASGADSGILCGRRNTASGTGAVALGGSVNTASGNSSFAHGTVSTASGAYSIALGASCSASGSNSIALGGTLGFPNQATSTNAVAIGSKNLASESSAVAIGSNCTSSGGASLSIQALNTASANYSFASGLYSLANRYGQRTQASGRFAALGDCQYERYLVRRATTDATQTELSCDGGAPAADTRIAIANDSTYTFTALVTARRTDADDESAGYKIEGVIDNNAGTTALVGTPTVTVLAEDTAAWDVVVEADNTNDALVFKVTGEANKTIRWGAVVELMKVSG